MRKLIAALACLAALAACDSPAAQQNQNQPAPGPPITLRILAGSELSDMQPILDDAAKATGVKVTFTFTGTLEGAQTLAGGGANGKYDAVWFSSNRYLQAVPEAAGKLGNQVKIMSSPVLLGLSASVAKRLGWDGKRVGWADIAAAAGRHEFSYGMTDPSASNSGFSALVGVSSALAGTGSAITAEQIAAVSPALTGFFSAQKLSAGSSGWLSDAYLRRATGADPGEKIDGLINYESVLLSLNAGGKLPEALIPIYPSDGVITADYPLTLLAGASDAVRTAHQRLADYLRTPDVQRKIMDSTRRRPAVPGVALSGQFTQKDLIELPFPATRTAMDGLLSAYFNKIRRPSRTLYVLDTSGSMAGERIASLQAALIALTGADNSIVGQFRKFRGREEVTLLPFSSAPGQPRTFALPDGDPGPQLAQITAFAKGLAARGGTAIYDSLSSAYAIIGARANADPDRFMSIVLMTDGENERGANLADFQARYRALPDIARRIPVFTVLFGEGNTDEMNQIAATTGGKTFDARTTPLSVVFQDIRGYQ
jgi:Ca-activated chloride channel family protein